MNPYKFTVSLRVWHSERELSDAGEEFGLVARRSWKQGERRRTPTGDVLAGTYPNSYWFTSLTNRWVSSRRVHVETFLSRTLDGLQKHRRYISNLRKSGGRVELFVGISSTKNFGMEFPPDLLLAASKIGVALSFDVYPYPQK